MSVKTEYRLARRLAQLEPSATAAMNARVQQLRAEGIKVISFSVGEPDFNTPEPIKVAAIEAINKNRTHYTPAGGTLEVRKVIAARVSADQEIPYALGQITTTAGAKEGLYLAFQALCDEGDEAIIPAPYWVSYVEQARLAGATPITPQTTEATGFKVTPEQLRAALSPRTRVVMLNSPSNPTGAVYSADELAALADVLRESDAIIIADEIYDAISYVPYARWLRVAPDMADRTLIVNGAAKAYAMTGWRFGYVAGPQPIITAIKDIQSHTSTHTASITQDAAVKAYTPSAELDEAVQTMVAAFHKRRDLVLGLLAEIPGVSCNVPDGAFYVFPNVTGLLNKPLKNGVVCATSDDLNNYLLDQAYIACVSGESFGAPGYIRLSYATSEDEIVEGMRRFRESVS
ncbi:pyridoxal phosphate-dependent aminotransferase [Candidatus Chloroploca sp. M-50]|uniref:Pyridoxal phosphate-dependent aminotransferase n=1 Tax=Candidatus Chloroploca mongolica TaxID=2528176 RepID=A0ABS4DDJ2_9CHLR|nr:pyridoxal phosphate-dependent aminotransferase [Candidatus Chloroploca mongolica]MBP1467505.1 pyridoxal phosphate-dependent aminotransferase [Candidatus Chloroploca mongolica]